MKEKNLRLRLVVRRHGLPEVRVVFNVPLEQDPTVSKLVELVNETIPLESGEWGLEDYAVELRDSDGHAFECMHFQLVTSILEKDEEVFIRPLFTEDIKKRRLSGRYQISSDGKHLIDGVAFGRQRLKVPRDRPAVHISPRKRRRLTYDDAAIDPEDDASEGDYQDEEDEEDDGDDEDYQEDEEPLLLMEHGELDDDSSDEPTTVRIAARFEDADLDAGHARAEDEDDIDGESGSDEPYDEGDDDMDLDELESTIDANELNALREEVADMEGWAADEEGPPVGRGQGNQLDLATLDRITALRATFPTVPVERCEKLLAKHKDEKMVYKKLAKSNQPQRDLEDMLAYNQSLHQPSPPPPGFDEMSEDGSEEEVDSITRHFDQHGFPPGSIAAGNALSHMAKVMRDSRSLNAAKLVNKKFDDNSLSGSISTTVIGATSQPFHEDDTTSDSGPSSDSESNSSSDDEEKKQDSEMDSDVESDSSSSDSDSGSNSDSDSGPEETPTKTSRNDRASSQDSDTSSSDSSSSDEKSEADVSQTQGRSLNAAINVSSDKDSSDDSSSDDSSSDDTSSSDSESDSDSDDGVAHAQTTAQKPNKQAKPATNAQSQDTPPVPPGQGMSKTQKRNARRRAARQAKANTPADEVRSAGRDYVEVSEALNYEVELLARKRELMEQFDVPTTQPSDKKDVVEEIEALIGSPPKETEKPPVTETPTTTSSQRKMRLDVSAGRRMLFGALGLKNPKTKPDEDRLRANLMKGVRPLANSRVDEAKTQDTADVNKADYGARVADDENEGWKSKITYRAVECCQEGITLSEPPFPFVQRWDPQQQSRGGKGKRKQRNQSQFYQDDEAQHTSKKQKVSQPLDSAFVTEADTSMGDIELDCDEGPSVKDKDLTAAESQLTDLDDLPSLPRDLSSLVQLRPGDAQVGMVITWTAWLLSSATGWQPQVSNLTGIVTAIEEDGTKLEVLLARRDRNLDRNEKNYDAETGQRVYDRFEAPDIEDGEADHMEDEGYRHLIFSEMGDPRIVQRPLETDQSAEVVADSQPPNDLARSGSPSGQSATLGREKSNGQVNQMDVDGVVFDSVITNPDNGRSIHSVSTQPGQVRPGDDHSELELSFLTTNAETGRGLSPSINSQGSNNSPTRQLEEETSEAAYVASLVASRQSSHQPLAESQPHATGEVDTTEHQAAGDATDQVRYPNLDILSAADSVYSGQQPDPSLNSDLVNASLARLVGTAAEPIDSDKPRPSNPQDHHDRTSDTATTKPQSPSSPAGTDISSASSIPSLSQVWHTASQVEAAKSLSKVFASSQKTRISTVQERDEEYEAAMRKLDEASDEESVIGSGSIPIDQTSQNQVINGKTANSARASKSILANTVTSPRRSPRMKREVQTFEESVSPPSLPTKRRKRQPVSEFAVPAGSQVVSLMTSSPEPEYSEDYADDVVDESYGGGSQSQSQSQKLRRRARGASLPAPVRGNARSVSTRRVAASQASEYKQSVTVKI